jgi:DNA-binding transcriptional LysR family regulator
MIYIFNMHEGNINNLDLNLLIALEALLEEVSVSKAALRVNLSQPAMSRALDRLRHALKDPLLVRAGRGMTLTPRAESLIDPMRDTMARVRNLMAPNEFVPAEATDTFKIMSMDYVFEFMMPRVLEKLFQQAPNISVDFIPISPSAFDQVRAGEIDLVIGVLDDGPKLDNVYDDDLMMDRLVCIMRKNHPLAGETLTLERFSSASHGLLSLTGRGGGIIDRKLAPLGLKRHISLRIPHLSTAQAIISSTDVIMSVPERFAETLDDSTFITQELPKELGLKPFKISQIWHDRFHQDPARKWLRSMVRQCLADLG